MTTTNGTRMPAPAAHSYTNGGPQEVEAALRSATLAAARPGGGHQAVHVHPAGGICRGPTLRGNDGCRLIHPDGTNQPLHP